MPTYDYRCFTCDARKTEVKAMSSTEPNPDCSKCKKPMQQIYSAPGLSFRGSGWGKDAR